MNKYQILCLENLLNERRKIAIETDKKLGNENGSQFLPNNPDYIYYHAIIDTIELFGCSWERKGDRHIIYKGE